MGLDFIKATAPSFKKGWDRDQKMLSQPTLFTRHPECQTRTINVELNDFSHANVGDEVTVCISGETLILVREMTTIGVVPKPPPDLFRAIWEAGECALGHVVQINSLSGTADVEVD